MYFLCDTALGDPLIKGLTEVANTRPKDPVQFLAEYLHSLSGESEKKKTAPVNQTVTVKPAATMEYARMNSPTADDDGAPHSNVSDMAANSDDRVCSGIQ